MRWYGTVGRQGGSRSCALVCLVGFVGSGEMVKKGAAARVVNDSIPALMAASCGRSMTQFAMGFQKCDQNDSNKSVQDVNVSVGNVSMVVDGTLYKQGWNHKVSSCAFYNLLGASTVARLLSTR